MNIAVSTEGPADDVTLVVTALERRIDASVSEDFKQKMIALVKNGPKRVVLDISDVEFIDSSGLGAIIVVLKQLGAEGELSVCGAQQTVLRMFKLTRMDRVFQLCATKADALLTTA